MKFEEIDRAYSAKKRAFCEKYGIAYETFWPVVNDWALYCGLLSLSRELVISDLLRSTLDVPGHVAEFGSWRGANLLFMAKILRIFDPHGQKQVHCFEGFEGLTTFAAPDAGSVKDRGMYRGSYEELVDVIALYYMEHEIVIHKGLVQDTLPAALAEADNLSFSLIYLDLDLYEPTKLALDLLHPRLSKGGLFVFDEWNYETYPGETTAAREFLEQHGDRYTMEAVRHTRTPSMALRKIAF
ncbi:MAG: TylF/MycF/NovP-related O-methyltransferase [Candidatus Elarobacter sp.]